MDIQIRTGEGLQCEYSGAASVALVRVRYADSGNEENAPWTDWMGRSALEQAMRMLSVAEGAAAPAVLVGAPPHQHLPYVQAAAPPPSAPPVVHQPPGWVKPTNPPALMDQFERQLNRLIDRGETEEDEKGNKRGLHEADLRDLISSYVDALPNHTQMFAVLRRKMAMERPRFDLLVSSIQASSAVERLRAADLDNGRALGEGS